MANKNINDLTLVNSSTGDFLAYWRTSAGTTNKTTVNRLVALTLEQSLTIPLTGCVSGAQNIGAGDGLIYSGNVSGVLAFRSLLEGSNITITTENNTITINAADPSAVPIQAVQNVGVGAGIFSGLQGVTGNFKSVTGASGITITNNLQNIVINGASGINVSSGDGTIFHGQIINDKFQFKSIEAGTGVLITNKTGTVQINNSSRFTGIAHDITYGGGDLFRIPWGTYVTPTPGVNGDPGAANQSPTWNTITFGAGSPSLSFPAGVGIYMIDFIFGCAVGSYQAESIWLKFRNSTAGSDITNSIAVYQPRGMPITDADLTSYYQITRRVIATITGPATVVPQTLYSGYFYNNVAVDPIIHSTGTTFSYLKIA